MRNQFTQAVSAAVLVTLLLGAAGCARVRGQQGFIADAVLVDGIAAGIDNRASVEKTLGRPTFVGQFNANEWFYVARQTKQLAFASPTPVSQTVLRISFDASGNVTAVDKTGVEKVVRINIEGDKTPTLGRNRGFFEDIFGNIGQVGSVGQSGGTADNPN